MSAKYYCVFKAPVELAKYGDIDHMVKGGIYDKLEHARRKAERLVEPLVHVWIEQYHGDIDVLSKTNMVKEHFV